MDNGFSFGEGTLPLEQREPLTQFEAEVVPAYKKIMEELAEHTHTSLTRLEPSRLNKAEGEVSGKLRLPILVIPAAIPCEVIVEIGNKYFPSTGFTISHITDKANDCDVAWADEENGGIISISSVLHSSGGGFSGIRPDNNPRTTHDYTPPAWEEALPWDEFSEHKPQSEPQSE